MMMMMMVMMMMMMMIIVTFTNFLLFGTSAVFLRRFSARPFVFSLIDCGNDSDDVAVVVVDAVVVDLEVSGSDDE